MADQTYTIQPGDNLTRIANKYGTNANTLASYNNIQNSNLIQAGASLNIPTSVSATSINAVKPLQVPPTPVDPTLGLNAMVASVAPEITAATAADAAAKSSVDQGVTDIQTLTKALGQQTADQTQAEANAGIPALNSDLNELQNQARQQTIEYNTSPYSLQGQGRGIPTAILRGQEAVKQRQLGIDIMLTNSTIQAKQGQVALAQQTADRAIAAKYDPIKADLESKKFILDANYKDLSRADQLLADDKTKQLNLQLKQIDQQQQNEKDINAIRLEAAKNGAPNSVLASLSTATTPEEAIKKAAGWFQDPLDVQYKKAQIAKIYSDIQNSGLDNVDPANVLAYAQQYASTGTIPTGIPKGTFGMISQVAKELPKSEGTLVDKNTGITSSSIKTATADGIASLYDLTKKITDAQQLYNKNGIGNRAEYNTLKGEIVDLLARARTGAAISANEEALYKSKLPNITFSIKPFGDIKLNGLEKSLTDKLDTTLNIHNASIYGYSKVDIGGQKYTVGDVISVNGVSGRINPDGTVTQITQ